MKEYSGVICKKSFMNIIKNKGPRTEPCGTPLVMGGSFDLAFLSRTYLPNTVI